MAFRSDEQPNAADIESRRPLVSLGLTALLAFSVGLLVGLSLADGDVGQSPAIEMAREVGLALPIAQQPAFADGVITRAEAEDALERLTGCVESQGVTGFAAALAGEGTDFSMEWRDGSMGGAVELCRLEHFEATYRVWSQQERSTD